MIKSVVFGSDKRTAALRPPLNFYKKNVTSSAAKQTEDTIHDVSQWDVI